MASGLSVIETLLNTDRLEKRRQILVAQRLVFSQFFLKGRNAEACWQLTRVQRLTSTQALFRS